MSTTPQPGDRERAQRVFEVREPSVATPSPVAEGGRDAAQEFVLYPPAGWLNRIDEVIRYHLGLPDGSPLGEALARLIRSWEGMAARDADGAPDAEHWGPKETPGYPFRPPVATREASAIARALVLVAQDHGHDKLVLVDTDEAADAVMPVLAEALAERDAKIAELRSLLRARDENLHVEAEGWKDMVSALSAQEARAKAERDLALWLHAEAVWRDQARHGLLDDLVREQTARCDAQGDFREALRQRDQARAERDRLSTLRAVVLPEDWKRQMLAIAELNSITGDEAIRIVESWRPSTGDTDGTRARAELRCTATTTHPLYGRVQCQVQRGHEGIHGRLHSNSHFGVHWEDAVFPEEHAEPEPAWGVDRPVHGHTEQTGDQ